MCYNITFLEKRAIKYFERYKDIIEFDWRPDLVESDYPLFYHVSGFQHPKMPVVKQDGIFLYEWGLIPQWVKDDEQAKQLQKMTLNAVGETVFEKPAFRKSIPAQRCILGVNSFFEWRDFNKTKYPYLIKVKNENIFSLGCIYENYIDKNTGEIRNTFSIVTTPANSLMQKIHNLKMRMPLIIDRQNERDWINPKLPIEKIKELIQPFDENKMEAFTISRELNNVRINRNFPEIIEPFEYPELEKLN